MSTYTLHLQQIRGKKFRVVLVGSNGKLVLCGESLENSADARALQVSLKNGRLAMGEDLTPYHKFPRNEGPKTKRVIASIEYKYAQPSAKAVKKLAKKSPPHIKAWLAVPKRKKK